MPHQLSWEIEDYRHIYSAIIFAFMGVLFSWVHERLGYTQKELKRINDLNLEVSQARLRLALESANAGLWEWNLLTNLNEWSDSLWDLYGLPAFSQQPSYDTWLGVVACKHNSPKPANKAIFGLNYLLISITFGLH